MAHTRNNQEQIKILEKSYTIACPPEECHALHDSAHLLDEKMREVRDNSKITNVDRIAVMAALNIAHELITERQRGISDEVEKRLEQLTDKISLALEDESQ